MDPITISVAMGVANSAFNAIKSGFAAARDIEQMSGDIGRWMGAVSDIDNAEKQLKILPCLANCLKLDLLRKQLSLLMQPRRNLRNKGTNSRCF